MKARYCIVLFCCLNSSFARQLPKFIKQCKRNDVDLDGCIKRAATEIQPRTLNGIPELKIPPMEPFRVDRVESTTGNMKFVLTNLNVLGLGNYDVDEFHVDFDRNEATARTYSKTLAFYGNYTMSGRLILLELEGSGYAEANISEIHSTYKLFGKRKVRDGKEYIAFETINCNLVLGDAKFRFDDLFKNNPELTARTNEVLNENSQDVLNEFKPTAEETVGTIVLTLFKNVFDHFSIAELFP